jgi:hypothetical protein
VGESPPTGLLRGYTQTYLVRKNLDGATPIPGSFGGEGKESDEACEYEVLFRCGNWCYTGHVMLKSEISLTDAPLMIPLLQRQQSRLHYYCNADGIPTQSNFHHPIKLVYEASDYAAANLSCDAVNKELAKWSDVHSWVEDSVGTFFGKYE